jgi:hypothetical protein
MSENCLKQMIDAISVDDVKCIMPEGLTNGTTLWIRLGGPKGKDAWMTVMKARAEAKTRARSGWMAGVALLIKANDNKGVGHRVTTTKMQDHLTKFDGFLADYTVCILSGTARETIMVTKDKDTPYNVEVPISLVTDELKVWCSTPWPVTDTILPRGF